VCKYLLDHRRVFEPTRVLGEIRATLPRAAIVTLDTRNACLQAADRLAHYQCPSLIAPSTSAWSVLLTQRLSAPALQRRAG
jgi:hypothetical protein